VSAGVRFEDFVLDGGDRRLLRGKDPVELNGRYFDALALLVREQGRLVTKDRFLAEVWRGVPVTDEALTQCIRTLRRQLGDDASSPRFIETVPKHGYRFIAPVEPVDVTSPREGRAPAVRPSRGFLMMGVAGTLGGGVAGVLGGLFYGLACATQPQADVGAVSLLLVLVSLTGLLALIGGAGVSFGIAAAARLSDGLGAWSILGGAVGGFIVGAIVKLLGHDAFQLLLGISPGDFAGATEGVLLGAAVGLSTLLAFRLPELSFRRRVGYAALIGGAMGAFVTLIGGRLLGGSLDLLVHQVQGSRLSLDQIGAMFGERGFGPVSQAVTAGLEGMAFTACVVAGMLMAHRRLVTDNSRLPTETI
jgi:DNA-binding winged helix-turn-helix (wHTH) protein